MSDNKTLVVERIFAALADRTRLRLLNLMAEGEICVCYLVEILGMPQPTISRHLAFLRRAALVAARREGKWMHYRILLPDDPAARNVLQEVLRWVAEDKQMRKDRARLEKTCCAKHKFACLQKEPAPISTTTLAEKRP